MVERFKDGDMVHGPTGISFPKSIARFKQKSAEPFHKDGTAIFWYSGDRGVITLYLGDRSLEGFPGKDDCAPALRDNYVREMLQSVWQDGLRNIFSPEVPKRGSACNRCRRHISLCFLPRVFRRSGLL